MAGAWNALGDELERWADDGRPATLWWRDDDACRPTPSLDRLLAVAGAAAVPLALAVIPDGTGAELAGRVSGAAGVTVLQHGWSHADHAGPGDKKVELGGRLSDGEALDRLAAGRAVLAGLFPSLWRPVLVPPWNRIRGSLVGRLRDAGYRGLSRFAPRPVAVDGSGLAHVNAHVDVMDWKGGRGFVGAAAALAALTAHLAARRTGRVDDREPTGLLTHHRVHDGATWDFLARLRDFVAERPGARWTAIGDALSDAGPSRLMPPPVGT